MRTINTHDISIELSKFIKSQRKVKFIDSMLQRAGYPNLRRFEWVHLNVTKAETFFIKLLKIGTFYKGKPSKDVVRTIMDMSRKWAARVARLKMEFCLDEVKEDYEI